ncbi:hypothetical protein [Yersinia enterocolitica]|nr:hypothetical protein [Yersinia enterocolitica]HEB4792178.1 hypothetical protein [Yersinia enterocolitica]HEF7264613.1 hypothetical protein [Yersinia enterocolitica]HEI6972959.1 hypothetical protein [Yersinia enterocolitica]HEM9134734.1 hypothetical protein [Yersinia enterocolitica]
MSFYFHQNKHRKGKKKTQINETKTIEISYLNIANFPYYNNARRTQQQVALRILTSEKKLFIETSFGTGLLKFLGSMLSDYLSSTKFFKINLEGCTTKNQIDEKILADTKLSTSYLMLHLNEFQEESFCIIFERISPKMPEDAINYLLCIATDFRLKNPNLYFIFSSATKINQLSDCSIKLDKLTHLETSTVLTEKYGTNKFSKQDIFDIYQLSEGIVSKLDHLMIFLDDCSAEELKMINNIFDDIYYGENLSKTTRDSIELLAGNPTKIDTFTLLKVLAVLKNGESIKTIRKTSLGSKLTPRNTKELTNLELAVSITIDSSTTIIKLNTIVKDYVLTIMSADEIAQISLQFLPLTVVVGKEKITSSSINRKTMKSGLKTEEDNAVSLLRNNISYLRMELDKSPPSSDEFKALGKQLQRLIYLSRAYVYELLNSSRFNEAATASHVLIEDIEGIAENKDHFFYSYLAFSQRMLGDHDLAYEYVNIAKSKCPEHDKATQRDIAIDELYLLEKIDVKAARTLAKQIKSKYKANTNVYIIADNILANALPTKEKITILQKNERKARRLQFTTTANNILLNLNKYLKNPEKLNSISIILSTEKSIYNTCRAKIAKYEIFLESNELSKITDSSINELRDIYNYLFFQGLESLFNRCHDLLWEIAVQRRIIELFESIHFQGILIWRLNKDKETEDKYQKLYNENIKDALPI